ncbi:MAG: redoxin domain-containing protein [Dehalococcoidia bacterium]|nr:redoxin domain-containing protein [Dehalococcoidia bacterium]
MSNNVKSDKRTPVRKHKETREKETNWCPPKESRFSTVADDDKDMRSLWAPQPVSKPVSSKTWGYIAAAAAAALIILLLALNMGAISQQISSTASQVGTWFTNPDPTPATASTNTTAAKPEPADTPTQSSTQTPASNSTVSSTVNKLEPVKDTTIPALVGEPTPLASATSVTITWKTDERATSLVKYGMDVSHPFSSEESSEKGTDHSIYISSLTPDTTYHYQVISTDPAGNTLASGDYKFTTESSTGEAPYMGSKAPDFTLTTLDSKDISLSKYRGKKVILNFWASWCTPCKVELPHLQELWEKEGDSGDFILLTVAGSQSEEELIRKHVNDNGYSFTVCMDHADDVFNRYGIVSIPRTYFIDSGGTIRRIQQGMFTSAGEVEFMLDSY